MTDKNGAPPPSAASDLLSETEALQTLAGLCHELALALTEPDYGPQTLRRQAQLLDRLVYETLGKMTADDMTSPAAAREWLDLGLRVQQQCLDTLKAVGAIEYMRTLSSPSRRPLPGRSKRTEWDL